MKFEVAWLLGIRIGIKSNIALLYEILKHF